MSANVQYKYLGNTQVDQFWNIGFTSNKVVPENGDWCFLLPSVDHV